MSTTTAPTSSSAAASTPSESAANAAIASAAQSSASALAREAVKECLSFRVADEEYGIDILRVQEIRSYEQATRVAGAPPFIRGVLNLRGVIVPVVDLRLKLGCEANFETTTVTVVINVCGRTVGMVVDAVSDVQRLTAEQIKPAPEFSGGMSSGHVIGLASITQGDAERLLILLDIERMMTSADMCLMEPTDGL